METITDIKMIDEKRIEVTKEIITPTVIKKESYDVVELQKQILLLEIQRDDFLNIKNKEIDYYKDILKAYNTK